MYLLCKYYEEKKKSKFQQESRGWVMLRPQPTLVPHSPHILVLGKISGPIHGLSAGTNLGVTCSVPGAGGEGDRGQEAVPS